MKKNETGADPLEAILMHKATVIFVEGETPFPARLDVGDRQLVLPLDGRIQATVRRKSASQFVAGERRSLTGGVLAGLAARGSIPRLPWTIVRGIMDPMPG